MAALMEYPLPLPAVLFGCLLPAQLAAAELSLSVTQTHGGRVGPTAAMLGPTHS